MATKTMTTPSHNDHGEENKQNDNNDDDDNTMKTMRTMRTMKTMKTTFLCMPHKVANGGPLCTQRTCITSISVVHI